MATVKMSVFNPFQVVDFYSEDVYGDKYGITGSVLKHASVNDIR